VSRRAGGTTTFYTFDERGNVCQRTGSTGAAVSSEVYDSYGSRTGTAAQADPFGYRGQAGYYTDPETGLLLCTHRFYDPGNGRWLTRDPLGYAGGVNLYGYVGNDPVGRVDPSGYMVAAGAILLGGTRLAAIVDLVGGGPLDPVGDAAAGAILLGTVAAAGIVYLVEGDNPPAASTLPDQTGNSQEEHEGDLQREGFEPDGKLGRYDRNTHPDGSRVCRDPATGRITRQGPERSSPDTPKPVRTRYGPGGEVIPYKPGADTHNTGENTQRW